MARLARIVIPGIPYHVTQRGNRRQQTFFEDGDYALYRDLLSAAARRAGCEVWAYCLMPNHVHLIVVPADEHGLRRTFSEAHRRYTSFINARHRWTGHLWQGRFGAVAMDEAHLVHAARYVALNPVRAGLADRAEQWPWSSARAHLDSRDDVLVNVRPLLDRVGDFAGFLDGEEDLEIFIYGGHDHDRLIIKTGESEAAQMGSFMNATLQSAGENICVSIAVTLPEHSNDFDNEDELIAMLKEDFKELTHQGYEVEIHIGPINEPDEDEDRCRTEDCDGDPNDGEGFDGYCGNCADRREAAGEGIES